MEGVLMADNPPILRTGERKAFGRCPQMWFWAFRCGLRSKRKPADALWFGIGIHEALAEWYGEGFDRGRLPWETFEDWVGDEVRTIKASFADHDREWFEEPAYEEALELGKAMLKAYVAQFGEDPQWEIIAIEQPFQLDIVDEGETIATFASRLDGALIDHEDNEIYILENKTAGTIRTAHLAMDNQGGGYFAAGTIVLRHQGIIGPDDNVFGIMYNFLRKSKPDTRERDEKGRYLNKDGSVSKRQPPRHFHREPIDRSAGEVRSQIRRIRDEVRVMNEVRAGRLPVLKNITDMCPNCQFFQMCMLHERGGTAWKDYRDAAYTVEDPYSEHRKSASE